MYKQIQTNPSSTMTPTPLELQVSSKLRNGRETINLAETMQIGNLTVKSGKGNSISTVS